MANEFPGPDNPAPAPSPEIPPLNPAPEPPAPQPTASNEIFHENNSVMKFADGGIDIR